jgi:hypothetical protein
MMFINIATGINYFFVVQIQVLKKHPIYYMFVGPVYMYSDWATALSAGKSPIDVRAGGRLKINQKARECPMLQSQ